MDSNISESDQKAFGNASENPSENSESIPHISGNDAETTPTIPNALPKDTRTEYHTLTVRDVAHIFEQEGLSVTERTVTNWCKPNARGLCRLDCFFEENEHRYYITPHSVEKVIGEEQNRLRKFMQPAWQPSENFEVPSEDVPQQFGKSSEHSESNQKEFGNNVPPSESFRKETASISEENPRASESSKEPEHQAQHGVHQGSEKGKSMWELQAEIVKLRIENKAKELFIEQLKGDRETFRKEVSEEREQLIKLLSERDRLIGEQREKLLQIEAPRTRDERVRDVEADEPQHLHAAQDDAERDFHI